MALAGFKLLKCTGPNAATETDTSKAPTFLSADEHDPVHGNHPIPAPFDDDSATGDGYSYECFLRLECTVAPDNYCQNVKGYGPSTQPDSPTNKVTVMYGTTDTGTTPVNVQSSIATVSQHDNYYSAATALSIGVAPSDGQITAVGEKTDYLVAQLIVEYGAAQGAGADIVSNWSWEEA